ncbi:EAL domain-containing protein [Pigmentiphaga aceris]|uniref:EAL domain-containing protein n=1 Tax=Pigmentiphaga aceris TaxID=1940612 RepID=A0A5C0AVL3_9BURK|nr:bifunctional diguanylate cyclase/phosphodiesterase [Pigmentiphaga aceris]QEI04701.1 EAL domain-containing protein [Pigmentiphaga aceris]
MSEHDLPPAPIESDPPSPIERRPRTALQRRQAAVNEVPATPDVLRQALQHAEHAQRLLETALWASGESIWEWSADTDAYVVRWFPAADAPARVSSGTLTSFISTLLPAHRDAFRLNWRLHATGASDVLDTAVQRDFRTGPRWIRLRGKAVSFQPDGQASRIVGTVKDITMQRDADYASQLMASAFASSRDAMVMLREDLRIIEANVAFHALLGVEPGSVAGADLRRYLDVPPALLAQIDLSGYAQCETSFHKADRLVPVEMSLSRFKAEPGAVSYLGITIRDIADRKRAENELERIARYDTLTQLPNRAALQSHLAQALRTVSNDNQLAVLFIDLDGFKEVNDSLGHEAGDEMLRTMAERLVATVPTHDMLARWGGDEFVAALRIGNEPERARRVARRILADLSQRITVRGHVLSMSGSIGIAFAPLDGADTESVLRHADAAMYAAKNAGKNRFALYHSGLAADALHRMTLLTQLRSAVERGQIDFVLQPKFDRDGTMSGAEVLARWNSEAHGVVSPAVFIPLAEQGGMAVALGNQAIDRAAYYAAALGRAGHRMPIAVNVSPLQVMEGQLNHVLHTACNRHRIEPWQLELEVTESVFLQDFDASEQRLTALRAEGFKIAMDDFGTGYSSLSYLRRLPVDTIKIDRTFLIDVNEDEKSRRLLAGVVTLCGTLGLSTIAEGVETEAQYRLLKSLGVDQYQGFYLARPMNLDDMLTILKR